MTADKASLANQLNEVHREIREEAAAFPGELRLVRPTPEDWCAMELLGHIAELHYSYVARGDVLIHQPGLELSRPMDSPERLEGIASGPARSLEEAFAALDAAREYALEWLARLAPDDLVVEGTHAVYGPTTVAEVFERNIVGHARTHLNQLRQTRRLLTNAD